MNKQLGVVMDPIEHVNLKKDSTIAIMESAQAAGWQISIMQIQHLMVKDSKPVANVQQCQLNTVAKKTVDFQLSERQERPLTSFDVILMRTDPPVNQNYIYATQILELAEQAGVIVANKPASLRALNEKLFALHFPNCCPPTLVSCQLSQIQAFHEAHKDIILKPLDGMGGQGIFKVDQAGVNISVIVEQLSDHEQKPMIAQKFLPEIEQGDKRILLINGNPIPFALARIPKDGETRGNLAAGGHARAQPLTKQDMWICEQIKPTLQAQGLYFVGIDVIGNYLTEINITSPTCIRELNFAYDLDIGSQLITSIYP